MVANVLRISDVKARTGQSRSTIYHRIAEGTFPKQIPLGGPRSVGWLESEVVAWIDSCVAQRDAKASNNDTVDQPLGNSSQSARGMSRGRSAGGRP